MYNYFQLAIKFAKYYLTASNGKGHGIHSPFVFNFIENILNDKKEYECYELIEYQRQKLLQNDTVIEVEDFGAGSLVIKTNKRVVKKIAASSLKPKKFSQLLFRMVQYYQPNNILELGTSFGITTSYLSKANNKATVHTCEGSFAIATIAKNTFKQLVVTNINLIEGDFTKTLPPFLSAQKNIDFAFIDGNHKKEPTVTYFTELLKLTNANTILVFDDIHWSKQMEDAWATIRQHPQVTLTIDLFFIGIVFMNPNFKIPQHFTIRF